MTREDEKELMKLLKEQNRQIGELLAQLKEMLGMSTCTDEESCELIDSEDWIKENFTIDEKKNNGN